MSEAALVSLPSTGTMADYRALTKPDINLLIAVATSTGFFLGRTSLAPTGAFPVAMLAHTVLGTTLVAGGAGALNQYIERGADSRMRRTARRPLASGRIGPSEALWFGAALSTIGSVDLAAFVNPLAGLVAVLTLVSYLFVYTPLKRRTPLCVLVGAFPGAAPPLIGWAAATGSLGPGAWLLFAILFLWQFPHFMAIAWMYREDYARAGYRVIPAGGLREFVVNLQTLLPLAALIVASLVAGSGAIYRFAALFAGLAFLWQAVRFIRGKAAADARRLLFASILYLPALFLLLIL
jgi:protoheme IX farnesyltransferase